MVVSLSALVDHDRKSHCFLTLIVPVCLCMITAIKLLIGRGFPEAIGTRRRGECICIILKNAVKSFIL